MTSLVLNSEKKLSNGIVVVELGNFADKDFDKPNALCVVFNRSDLFITVSVIEVERLWKRFQQLGANKNGILTAEAVKNVPVNADVFAKNVSLILLYLSGTVPKLINK